MKAKAKDKIYRHGISGEVYKATSLDAIVALFAPEKREAVRKLVAQGSVAGVVVYTNLNKFSIFFGQRTAVVYGETMKVRTLDDACRGTLGKDEMTFQFPTLWWSKK